MIYLLIVTVEDDLLVFRLHHLDTLLNDVVSIVIFNVFLYPRFKFLLTEENCYSMKLTKYEHYKQISNIVVIKELWQNILIVFINLVNE